MQRSDRSTGHGEDGGFVLTWFALFLLVMMAMAGFSVDVWNWWYTAQRTQNAADAASLGGVVYLPDTSLAVSQAQSIAVQNGFATGDTTAMAGANKRTLTVSIETTVDNFFTGLLGVETTTIGRDATAEFTGDVPMGSPENFLGNDPDESQSPDHWISVSGRSSTKQGGDRYQSENCSQSAFRCPGSGNSNSEYDANGYSFRINTASAADADLSIEVFDATHNFENNQNCAGNQGNRLNMPSGLPDYAAWYNAIDFLKGAPSGDSATRYATGENAYCVGDSGQADNMTTTFIVRSPDGTVQDDFDNPIYASGTCTRQYGAINDNSNWLRIIRDVYAGTDTNAEHVEFAQTYREWTTLCTIPQGTVNSFRSLYGDDSAFVVQVRTNSPLGNPCSNPPACNSAASTQDYNSGRNHFSIRAGYGSDLHGDVRVFANERLPIHAASRGANTEFFLARVGSNQAGRFLKVEFFDTGDAASAGSITMLQPDEIGDGVINGAGFVPFTTCAFSSTGGATTSSGCQLTNVVNNGVYQGQVVTAQVNIPTTYSCQDANPLGCWVKIRFAYPAGTDVFDHTVWSAAIVGDPVRLTE